MSDVEYVEALLKHAKLDNYQIGLTKVFLRAGQMALLQSMRLDAMNEAARKIQRVTRHFLFNRHRRRAALLIQTHWRGHCARVSYQQLQRDVAAVVLQLAVPSLPNLPSLPPTSSPCIYSLLCPSLRFAPHLLSHLERPCCHAGHCARAAYQQLRREVAATAIQAAERGRQQRLRFLQLRHAAVVVQAAVRMHLCRTAFINTRRRLAATRIQSTWRGYIHRRPWRALKHVLAGRVARLRLHNLKLEASRQAELAPPRKKTDVAIDTIRMMMLRVMRDKAEKSRASSERQLAEVRAELERTKKELAGKAREVVRLVGQLEQEQQRAEQAEERLEELLREQDRERAEGRERVLHVASVASHKAAAGGGGAAGGAGAAGALSSLPSFGGSGFSSSSSSPSAAAAAVAALAGGALGGVVDKQVASQHSGGRAGAPGGNLGVPEGSRILARMASRRHPSPHTPANHPTGGRGGMAAAAAAAVAAMDSAAAAGAGAAAGGDGTHDSGHRGHGGADDGHHLPSIQESASREEGEEKKVVAVSRTSSGGSGTAEFGGSSVGLRHVRFPSLGPEESEAEAGYTRASTLPVGRSMLRQQSMVKALKPAATADAAAGSGGATDGADARLARIRRLQSSNPRMGGGAGGEGGGGPGVPRPLVSAKSLTREEAVRMLTSAQRDAEEAQKVSEGHTVRAKAAQVRMLASAQRDAEDAQKVKGGHNVSEIGRHDSRGAEPGGGAATLFGTNITPPLPSRLPTQLKEERRQLQVLYREAVAATEAALAAAAEERGRVGELQQTVEGKDEEIRELTDKNQELQLALTLKAREVRTLSQRLLASQAESETEEMPVDKQQELLLSEVASSRFPFGPEGQPVAACMVYRALLQWGALEAEKTNTFDRIVEAFQRGSNDPLLPSQAYWLTNHVVLYYLVQVVYQPPVEQPAQESFTFSFFGMASRPAAPPKAAVERVDVMLFKQQLATGTERLFVTIRDAAKAELSKHFALPSQEAAVEAEGDPAAGDTVGGKAGKAGGGGGRRLARAKARAGGRSGAAMVRKHVVNYWAKVVVTLKQVTATLAANHVPAVVVDALLRQLLFFVNVKIVNGLMVRAQWCPCTYSNGELMEEGLGRLEQWVHDVEVQLRDAMGATKEPLKRELRHIRQAIYFLTLDHKPRRSLEEIEELCPDLTLNQLVHMCIWYEDDAYGTKGVDPSVTERMWALMLDDCPMLLRDDESIPFTVDDIALAMPAMHIDHLEPPPELQHDPAFHFLLPYSASATAAAPHTGAPLPSTPSMPAPATTSDRSIHLPVRSASAAGDYSSPATTPRAVTPSPAPEAPSFSAWDLLRGGAWRRAVQPE
ncbi:unnamed protein product [Closterium sp. Yama58-4]|nr:unnamed protein product [Closterium sp. Yama58-4]